MRDHGFDARVDEAGNAIGIRGNGPHRIVLLGHIDTFPGELPVRREGDWLYGRGTVDAKGPLCTFAAAASSMDVPPGWQVVVVGAVEEEAATSRGARHLIQTFRQAVPDMCIIGEPGGWDRIALGYKGRLLVDLKLRAPFAHSAGEARLPAEQAVDLWNRLVAYCADLNADRQKAFDRLDPSLRHIVTGDDGAYGTAQMSLGFRLPTGLSPDTLAQELQKLLLSPPQPLAPPPGPCKGSPQPPALSPQPSIHLTFSGAEVAFRAGKNTPLVRAFLASIREQGGEARFVLKTGTSDMNVVGPAWNCPICAYGPGDSKLDHTPEECINLSEYLRSIGVLTDVLQTLMDNRPYAIRSRK
jgi:LysW-gamma-L-lysine carboxypeptidase